MICKAKNRGRKAVSGILAAILLFGIVFSIGTFYLISVNNASQMQFNAGISSLKQLQLRQSEDFKVISTTVGSNAGFYVNNTGPVPIIIISAFVSNTTKLLKAITTGLSIAVAVGGSTISSAKDTLVPTSSCTAINPCAIKVVTKNGNSGVALFPVASQAGSGGVLLSTYIQAGPSPLSEGQTVTVTVTVFNYASSSATGVLPTLSAPAVTGSATVSACQSGCAQGTQTIPAGSNRNFTYTYLVYTGGNGGTASFSGYATGSIQGTNVASSYALSAPVQIGSFAGALNALGFFSANYTFFKYTDATHQIPPANSGAAVAGSISSSDKYAAFYVQVQNNYNLPLKIMKYSYLQFVRTGSEQSFFIVKTVSLAPTPDTLTAYTMDQSSAPNDPNWIIINPGQAVILAFAAVNWGTNTWMWGNFAFPGCGGSCTEADSIMIVLAYLFNGAIFAQAIPFEAVVMLP